MINSMTEIKYKLTEDVTKGEELKEYISPDKAISFLMVKRTGKGWRVCSEVKEQGR